MESPVDAGNYTKFYEEDPYQSYPESVDWRTKGAVTSVKDQVTAELVQLCNTCSAALDLNPSMLETMKVC